MLFFVLFFVLDVIQDFNCKYFHYIYTSPIVHTPLCRKITFFSQFCDINTFSGGNSTASFCSIAIRLNSLSNLLQYLANLEDSKAVLYHLTSSRPRAPFSLGESGFFLSHNFFNIILSKNIHRCCDEDHHWDIIKCGCSHNFYNINSLPWWEGCFFVVVVLNIIPG